MPIYDPHKNKNKFLQTQSRAPEVPKSLQHKNNKVAEQSGKDLETLWLLTLVGFLIGTAFLVSKL